MEWGKLPQPTTTTHSTSNNHTTHTKNYCYCYLQLYKSTYNKKTKTKHKHKHKHKTNPTPTHLLTHTLTPYIHIAYTTTSTSPHSVVAHFPGLRALAKIHKMAVAASASGGPSTADEPERLGRGLYMALAPCERPGPAAADIRWPAPALPERPQTPHPRRRLCSPWSPSRLVARTASPLNALPCQLLQQRCRSPRKLSTVVPLLRLEPTSAAAPTLARL